uniref:Uncharacterized protein n=1 Tax=Onchocerca volvulus TaxID=6282 RepID=A0A8R1XPJ4_ONCVO
MSKKLKIKNGLVYINGVNGVRVRKHIPFEIFKDEQELLNAKIVHGYGRKSALSNKNAILLPQEDTEQKTLDRNLK